MLIPVEEFQTNGKPIYCERYGQGHINDTYLVETDKNQKYILQRLNEQVFHDIPALMHNLAAVTKHLSRVDPRPRHVLTLVPTKTNENYLVDTSGGYWRMYDYIANSICLQQPQSNEDFYQSALAFGTFQGLLSDFCVNSLHETIPHFHDTPDRYRKLHEAIAQDSNGRLRHVQPEVNFALAMEKEADTLIKWQKSGELPLRVTHNDTKLNNVMLDATTRKALCVIDLDTVMPGLAANDFGDSIRFGASTALEDEKDLSMVSLSIPLYTTYAKGFLTACGEHLTQKEIESLPLGAKLMTLECGIRFLTDYLSGDVYFRIARPEHNLDRARTQFALVKDMNKHWQEMTQIIADAQKDLR